VLSTNAFTREPAAKGTSQLPLWNELFVDCQRTFIAVWRKLDIRIDRVAEDGHMPIASSCHFQYRYHTVHNNRSMKLSRMSSASHWAGVILGIAIYCALVGSLFNQQTNATDQLQSALLSRSLIAELDNLRKSWDIGGVSIAVVKQENDWKFDEWQTHIIGLGDVDGSGTPVDATVSVTKAIPFFARTLDTEISPDRIRPSSL
jgi:hypothetical protein